MSQYRLNLFISPEHAKRLDELAAKAAPAAAAGTRTSPLGARCSVVSIAARRRAISSRACCTPPAPLGTARAAASLPRSGSAADRDGEGRSGDGSADSRIHVAALPSRRPATNKLPTKTAELLMRVQRPIRRASIHATAHEPTQSALVDTAAAERALSPTERPRRRPVWSTWTAAALCPTPLSRYALGPGARGR